MKNPSGHPIARILRLTIIIVVMVHIIYISIIVVNFVNYGCCKLIRTWPSVFHGYNEY